MQVSTGKSIPPERTSDSPNGNPPKIANSQKFGNLYIQA